MLVGNARRNTEKNNRETRTGRKEKGSPGKVGKNLARQKKWRESCMCGFVSVCVYSVNYIQINVYTYIHICR